MTSGVPAPAATSQRPAATAVSTARSRWLSSDMMVLLPDRARLDQFDMAAVPPGTGSQGASAWAYRGSRFGSASVVHVLGQGLLVDLSVVVQRNGIDHHAAAGDFEVLDPVAEFIHYLLGAEFADHDQHGVRSWRITPGRDDRRQPHP